MLKGIANHENKEQGKTLKQFISIIPMPFDDDSGYAFYVGKFAETTNGYVHKKKTINL